MAELVVMSGVASGTVFVLGDVPAVVGRSPEAHLRVGDPWISSMHAMFERRDDGLWVVDLESRNGVFIEDERVTEARVLDGAVVRLGRTEIRYVAGPTSRQSVPPAPAGEARPPFRRETSRPDLNTPASRSRNGVQPGARSEEFRRRPATVLRMSIDDAGLEPGQAAAGIVRAAVDAAMGAAVERGAVVGRLAATGIVAVFGLEASPAAAASGRAAVTGPSHRPQPAPGGRVRTGDTGEVEPVTGHAGPALSAARAARQAVRDAGALELRAGLDTGPVMTGTVPGSSRPELAVLGPAAERAERLVAIARPGEILAGPGAASAPGLKSQGLVRIGDLELEVFVEEPPA